MKHAGLALIGLFAVSLLLPQLPDRADAAARPTPTIAPALVAALTAQPADQPLSVIVMLSDQLNTKVVQGRDRKERRRKINQELRTRSTTTQVALRRLLRTRAGEGKIVSFTPLWIINAIAVKALPAVIAELAKQPEVKSIQPDIVVQAPLTPVPQAATSAAVEPNLTLIGAPSLWSLGFRGQGVVVANMDTGVDATHPDLAPSWRGGSNSWYDPYGQHPNVPSDVNGHGTWTMGVMVGGASGGSAVGVAPQAKWIAAKIFNDSGTATATGIHQSFQWLLDPDGNPQTDDAPDIVNNSWALGVPGCSLDFELDLENLVAAGINPVFAAGNYGSAAGTSVSPANNPAAFAVGAVANDDTIYSGSSRGPTSCGLSAPTTYPALVAPGVTILTTDLYDGYYTPTGTSLAAPHASGGLALLLSAFPGLTVDRQRAALTQSARDLGTLGADNVYGVGRIDLLAAYNLLTTTVASTTTVTTTATATATSTSQPAATSTSQPTATWTPAATSTGLPTATNTSQPTATWTPAATSTGLPTATNTSQPTATWTPAATSTARPTATWTPAATSTGLPTATNTTQPTATNTPLPSATNTTQPTATWTPAASATATATRTATPTASATATATRTATPTASATATATRTATPTASATATATRTATPTASATATAAAPADQIFVDGFESGGLGAWSAATTASGKLSVTTTAALVGTRGMQAKLSGTTTMYVTDSSPNAESAYRARFYFSPNSVTLSSNTAQDLLAGRTSGGSTVFRVQLQKTSGGSYQIRGLLRTKSGSDSTTSWYTISNASHPIEVAWKAATSSSASDGWLSLSIDGALKQTRSSVQTGTLRVDEVRLGPASGLGSGSAGTEYFDGFVSTRTSSIGP